jgi:hypothetical protein
MSVEGKKDCLFFFNSSPLVKKMADALLNGIGKAFALRTSMYNAVNVGIRAIKSGSDLEVPSEMLTRALASANCEQAVFAFDVLNSLCGGQLPPMPSSLEPESSVMANSDGTPLSYETKVSLAADLLNAIRRVDREIASAKTAATQELGRGGSTFLKALSLLYPSI